MSHNALILSVFLAACGGGYCPPSEDYDADRCFREHMSRWPDSDQALVLAHCRGVE